MTAMDKSVGHLPTARRLGPEDELFQDGNASCEGWHKIR